MRTKTLLMAAAALAAGLLSSNAQVFSANVVGYYNLPLVSKKAILFSAQLPAVGKQTFLNNELINFSDQNLADGCALLVWNGATFDTYIFVGPGGGGPAWADQGGNAATNAVALGTGSFLQYPNTANSATPVTLTIVGQVVQGLSTNQLALGNGYDALPFPVGTNVDSTIGNMNTASTDGDVLARWTPTAGPSGGTGFFLAADTYIFVSAANGGPAWADAGGNQAFPQIRVGEGFLYQHFGGTSNWVRNFTVQ